MLNPAVPLCITHLGLELLPEEGVRRRDEEVGGRRPLRRVQPAAVGDERVERRRQRAGAVRVHQRLR